MRDREGKKKRRSLSAGQKASLFRIAAFLAAALPPAIRALMLFPIWREERVIQVSAGLGVGGIVALGICVFAFKDTIIGTVKRHAGVARVLVIAVIYILLVGLRKAIPYIPKLEEIAFYALIGGLLSWGLSALSVHFQLRGEGKNGTDQS